MKILKILSFFLIVFIFSSCQKCEYCENQSNTVLVEACNQSEIDDWESQGWTCNP